MLIITDPRAHVMCTKFTEPKIAVNDVDPSSSDDDDQLVEISNDDDDDDGENLFNVRRELFHPNSSFLFPVTIITGRKRSCQHQWFNDNKRLDYDLEKDSVTLNTLNLERTKRRLP